MMTLSPVAPSELPAVCELYRKAAAQPGRSLEYPRWNTESEILAEFSRYGGDPYRDLLVVRDGAQLIAVAGILTAPSDRHGILIGPAVHVERDPCALLPALLREVELRASRTLVRLRASAPENNEPLCAALRAGGWQARSSLTMSWTASETLVLVEPLAAAPRPLDANDSDAELRAVSDLLAREFGWDGDPVQRLRASLNAYRLETLWNNERCIAAIVWGALPRAVDAHLEFLAVAESERGRGLGSALLTRALQVARRAGIRRLWLSVWSDNPAVRLYTRHGFRIARRIMLFDKELPR